MQNSKRLFLLENSFLKFKLVRERRFNKHPLNVKRAFHGEYFRIFKRLHQYPQKFYEYMRMMPETFKYILDLIKEDITPTWSNYIIEPIGPEERLVITIRFLATGRSFRDMALTFCLGLSTIRQIIMNTTKFLWVKLRPRHMKAPTTEDFLKIAANFYERWNFPNCIGAIDGKHIAIKCPPNSGSMFFNYKKFFSIVLQGVADADGKFIAVEVGGYGKQSDGGTFRASKLYKNIEAGTFNIPEDECLPGTNEKVPYVLLGDEAYPLMVHLLRPFGKNSVDQEKDYFNHRHSRARRVIECAFGRLTAKWRILTKSIETSAEFADYLVCSVCVLHNMLIDMEGEGDMWEYEGKKNEHKGRQFNRSSGNLVNMREKFKKFICENRM